MFSIRARRPMGRGEVGRPLSRERVGMARRSRYGRAAVAIVAVLGAVAFGGGGPASAISDPVTTTSFSPGTNTVGNVSTLTISLDATNSGTSFAGNLSFTDDLPAGLVVATPGNLTDSCG